jgi:uncharacterized membrane protein
MASNKIGTVMIEIVMAVILIVIGLAMAAPLNSTIENMTTGENATAQGAAATSMWGLIPLLFGVLLLLIPLGSVIKSFRGRQ